MAAPFSWSDTLQITFASCLPCIRPTPGGVALDSDNEDQQHQPHNPAINRIPRARPDELQGLLADPDTDPEAETMSLQSNPGRTKRNRKKNRSKRASSSSGLQKSRNQLTLFGYTLFGHTSQPIELPEDGEDALYADSSSNSNSNGGSRSRSGRKRNESLTALSIGTAASTASTFDLDAAPLDPDTINALSSPTAAAAAIEAAAKASAAAEAARLKEKEERRQKRKERKEMKRLAQVLASQAHGGEEFEGFQGSGGGGLEQSHSGSGYPRIPNAMYPAATLGGAGRAISASDSGSGSGFSGSARDGFGRFVSAPNGAPLVSSHQGHDEEDDEAADLDGKLYSRIAPSGSGALGLGGGSDSRSRTSASVSDRPSPMAGEGPGFQVDPRNNALTNLRSRSYSYSQSSSSRVNSPLQNNFQAGVHDRLSNLDVRSQSTGMSTPPLVPVVGTPTTAAGAGEAVPQKKEKSHKKPKSKTSSSSRSRTSESVSASSPSIPSPVSPSFSNNNNKTQRTEIVSPSTVEHGQGFFDLEDLPVRIGAGTRLVVGEREQEQQVTVDQEAKDKEQEKKSPSAFPSTRIGGGGDGFPSTGFAGGGVRRAKDFGAFLARRGDDEEADH